MPDPVHSVRVIDSHTEGEPTRVVVAGYPELGPGSAADRLRRLRAHHDGFRSSICNEPRGFDALVGSVLLPPSRPDAIAQVIFFNNVGYLGMCVHGAIGVGETLRHLGHIQAGAGRHRLETPVGDVFLDVQADGSIAIENIESFRAAKNVSVETVHHGTVTGDVAWGGNWFFLIEDHGLALSLANLDALTDYAWEVRGALRAARIVGRFGIDEGTGEEHEIDHIELFGPPQRLDADSRNFVLCPGRAYDRSPCGTGTSAKMACLAADGKLQDGELWRQESIIGSRFTGTVVRTARGVVPTVSGRAWVTAESTLMLRADDPLREGIRPPTPSATRPPVDASAAAGGAA